MKTCIILRGLPGSGKTTLAEYIEDLSYGYLDIHIYTTDDYFIAPDGNYNFNASLLGAAHKWNYERFKKAAESEKELIILANTNTTEKEFKNYIDKAEEFGYTIFSLVVENRHRGISTHNVPAETVNKMRGRFKVKL